MRTSNKKRHGMFPADHANRVLNDLLAKRDSRDKFEKLCNFMYKVAPMSYEWNRAREETKRLKEEGFGY